MTGLRRSLSLPRGRVDTDRLRCDLTRASHGFRFAASGRRDDRRVDLRARLLYDDR